MMLFWQSFFKKQRHEAVGNFIKMTNDPLINDADRPSFFPPRDISALFLI